VGKTTTAINLSASLATSEKKVLLIDCDPQGNTTSGVGIDKAVTREKNLYRALIGELPLDKVITRTQIATLDVIPSNQDLIGVEVEFVAMEDRERKLKNVLKGLRSPYDFIIIDCPPSLGFLTINSLVAADFLIIPLQCEYFAMEGLGQLLALTEGTETGGIRGTVDFRVRGWPGDRQVARVTGLYLLVREVCSGHHSVDAVLPYLLQHLGHVSFAAERKEQQVHSALHETLVQLKQHLRVRHVGEVGDDHRDHVRPPGDQAAGDRIRPVAQRVGCLDDLGAGLARYAGARRVAAGDSGLRHAREKRDVVRGCRRLAMDALPRTP
jgi:hypothetical protein